MTLNKQISTELAIVNARHSSEMHYFDIVRVKLYR